jgi:hypothetical protein
MQMTTRRPGLRPAGWPHSTCAYPSVTPWWDPVAPLPHSLQPLACQNQTLLTAMEPGRCMAGHLCRIPPNTLQLPGKLLLLTPEHESG